MAPTALAQLMPLRIRGIGGVTWIVRNFSPIPPDALAIPDACAVVFVMAVAVSPRKRANDDEG